MNHTDFDSHPVLTGEIRHKHQQQCFGAPFTSDARTSVQELNNRGCVKITLGNYSEANHLFELALFRHKTIVESRIPTHHHHHNDCSACDLEYEYEEDDNSLDSNDHDYDHDHDYDEDYDEDYDDDDCMKEEEDNDGGDSSNSSQEPIVTQPLEGAGPIGSCLSLHHRQKRRIQRMTSCSVLPTFSFSGQHQYNERQHRSTDNHGRFHEIYCLPIVMDDSEWMSASVEDKTFVLIFNTAVCNHLWGMHSQREQMRLTAQSERAYLVAAKLYRLALDNASMHNDQPYSKSNNNSIDYRICVVALLNNLSHVSKTLEGPCSQEGLKFDQILLKAIFWWRDTQRQQGQQGQGPAVFPQQTDENESNDNDDIYEDEDFEIISLFLDNVFYLIGGPEQSVPAAAA